ncbi:5-formyltetrahydrofolate cyclo-ligase [Klebsiella pneumoniae]|nr:5-formyltetrahydrofolate cyclo-ligase [Klebsiella pneumoniae]MED6100638.1 5-formyltetrahydrofolate cyclo-ligase [Klebsiella pneumoniae]
MVSPARNETCMTIQPDTLLSRQHIRQQIREPKLDVRDVLPLAELDVLVTPLVAFDVSGQRLGMGGGFYDRTLQNWQQYRLQPVGYAHDCQQVDSLPSEEWDIPLPAVITPGKTWCW